MKAVVLSAIGVLLAMQRGSFNSFMEYGLFLLFVESTLQLFTASGGRRLALHLVKNQLEGAFLAFNELLRKFFSMIMPVPFNPCSEVIPPL